MRLIGFPRKYCQVLSLGLLPCVQMKLFNSRVTGLNFRVAALPSTSQVIHEVIPMLVHLLTKNNYLIKLAVIIKFKMEHGNYELLCDFEDYSRSSDIEIF